MLRLDSSAAALGWRLCMRQLEISDGAAGKVGDGSTALYVGSAIATITSAADKLAGGIAIAGAITGGASALAKTWSDNHAINHGKTLVHFFNTSMALSLFSHKFSVSLIPEIKSEINEERDKQTKKDSQPLSRLQKTVEPWKKKIRKFNLTTGKAKDSTSNPALFALAQKHVDSLANEIFKLYENDIDKFHSRATDIYNGKYADVITWLKSTIK